MFLTSNCGIWSNVIKTNEHFINRRSIEQHQVECNSVERYVVEITFDRPGISLNAHLVKKNQFKN